MDARRIVAKPVGIAVGAVTGSAFRTAWRRADHGREVPQAGDEARSWRAVLTAAALQGAVFAVVHAIVERTVTRPHHEAGGHA